jgi:predicted phage tail protein
VIHPTIHLNGTSAETLARDTEVAIKALRAAIDAMCDTAPNGRDYYPQGPDAIKTANHEHLQRMSRLRTTLDEMGEMHARMMEHLAAKKMYARK